MINSIQWVWFTALQNLKNNKRKNLRSKQRLREVMIQTLFSHLSYRWIFCLHPFFMKPRSHYCSRKDSLNSRPGDIRYLVSLIESMGTLITTSPCSNNKIAIKWKMLYSHYIYVNLKDIPLPGSKRGEGLKRSGLTKKETVTSRLVCKNPNMVSYIFLQLQWWI